MAQNINHGEKKSDTPTKKPKLDSSLKHTYPDIPPSADDDEANRRNVDLLLEEFSKTKPPQDTVKRLLTHTFAHRRMEMLNDLNFTVSEYISQYKMLKKALYVSCKCIC